MRKDLKILFFPSYYYLCLLLLPAADQQFFYINLTLKVREGMLVLLIVTLCSILFCGGFLIRRRWKQNTQRRSHPTATLILTQTPANHSPRAYAHATAVLACNLTEAVIFVAEAPSPPPHPDVHFIPIIPPSANWYARNAWTIICKLIKLARALQSALQRASALPFAVNHIIVNSPPILPTLPMLLVLRWFYFPFACVTLDVHNLAFTLMRLTSSPFAVHVAALAEATAIQFAHNHWTVSAALAGYLRAHFRVRAVVVYDRPRRAFLSARDASPLLLARLLRDHAKLVAAPSHRVRRALASLEEGEESLSDIPLVVSSSSWTPDEDFSVLLQALPLLDAMARPLMLVLTGKGPLRERFEADVLRLQLSHVAVAFAWLPMDDYPRLLAAASIGICLHASSSGLDLPMKAVDFLAAGTPVLALRYPCIHELVISDETGFLFDDAATLVALLRRFLVEDTAALSRLRSSVRHHVNQAADWTSCWQKHALPTLRAKPPS